MKNGIHLSILVLLLMPSLSCAAMPDCREAYFSPDDSNHIHPLLKPAPEFAKSYSMAKNGDAVEQRNVAVSYDAGYMVAACPDKARYWYQKAARNGDQIAQEWVARDEKLTEMLDGPEFMRVDNAKPSQALAVAQKTSAGGKQRAEPGSVEDMLADITRPPDPSSDMGKMIEIGRLVGGLMSSK